MAIRKRSKHEFSYVTGFGDSIRPGGEYGFPTSELERIKAKHPHVEVVWNVDLGAMAVYAVKSTTLKSPRGWVQHTIVQKLFNVADPSEAYHACEQLDQLRARAHADRDGRKWEQELIDERENAERDATNRIINDDVLEEATDFLWGHVLDKGGARTTVL